MTGCHNRKIRVIIADTNKTIFVFSFFQGIKIMEILFKLVVLNIIAKIAKNSDKNL